jgi:hypothetical protein
MPGTRDLTKLDVATDSSEERPQKTLLSSIIESWVNRSNRLDFKDVARPGFAVAGSDRSALRAAYAVFVDGAKPRDKFSPDEVITLVFFSESAAGNYVRIVQVERKDNRVEIQYRLKP